MQTSKREVKAPESSTFNVQRSTARQAASTIGFAPALVHFWTHSSTMCFCLWEPATQADPRARHVAYTGKCAKGVLRRTLTLTSNPGPSTFSERLRAAAAANRSWLMIGLDPIVERLPDGIGRDLEGVLKFNRSLVEATHDLVIGYKPNFAFYEALGPRGWEVLARTREVIPGNLLALADAKRGDIGDTSEMYARAIFDTLGFDAVTLSPYVGREGLAPFLARADRGSFILCRTSNRDESFQDLRVASRSPSSNTRVHDAAHPSSSAEPPDRTLYELVAGRAVGWGDNVGLVVGGTDVAALGSIRGLAPRTPFLVPGIGAQGGVLEAAVVAASDASGQNAIISCARSVIYASPGKDFAGAARREAESLRDRIRWATETGRAESADSVA